MGSTRAFPSEEESSVDMVDAAGLTQNMLLEFMVHLPRLKLLR